MKRIPKNNPKRKSASRKKETLASAVYPLITKLYDGTADLIIRLPQKPKKNSPENINGTASSEEKELIELTLPQLSKDADNSDRVAALSSALISTLLKDIESAKQTNRKAVQAEGIARARAKGTRFGPEYKDLDAELFEKLCQAYRNNEISASAAGRQLGCNYKTFQRRYAQQYPDEKKSD